MIRRSIENVSSIGEDEQDTLKRLIKVSNYLAVNGCPYTDFHGLVDLEKMHRVKFLKGKSYENETTRRDFIQNAAECLLQEDLEKLKRANFISVLSDKSTDAAIVEKECIYIPFVDRDEFKPKLLFFALKDPISQDADGLYDAIKRTFSDKNADTFLKNKVFSSSDGTAVNSSLNAGINAKFKESYNWVVFIWCVSHGLESALKDALKNWFESVDTCSKSLLSIQEIYQEIKITQGII